MKRLIATSVACIAFLGGVSVATAQPIRPYTYDAVVVCNTPMQEDGFAHVKLVEFSSDIDEPVVYKCIHKF